MWIEHSKVSVFRFIFASNYANGPPSLVSRQVIPVREDGFDYLVDRLI